MMNLRAFQRFPTIAAARNPAQVETIVLSTVGSYLQDVLLDSERRAEHKKYCTELMSIQDDGRGNVNYTEQAILANLDWGMGALEEAIRTQHEESKNARLEHAEKMLQVCALLDTKITIAGVQSSYLSAWASLNLACLWKLRNNKLEAAIHILDMFLVDPRSARIHLAPVLWERLFQPHLTSIKGWYSLQRHRIKMPDSDTSYSYSREDMSSEVLSLTAEQVEQLEQLEKLYQASLDDHTRAYARYYKDWLTFTADSSKKRIPPLMPIAEPPMTPVHELAMFHQKDILQNRTHTTIGEIIDNPIWEEEDNDVAGSSTICHPDMEKSETPESSSNSSYSPSSSQGGSGSLSGLLKADSTAQSPVDSPETSPYQEFPEESDGLEEKSSPSSSFTHVDASESSEVSSACETQVRTELNMVQETALRPPKDFVCPITNQLFDDPVTLETGQTYERRAIYQRFSSGNTTCPITGKLLSCVVLPSTNYLLKRLIVTWKEQHSELHQEFSSVCSRPSTPELAQEVSSVCSRPSTPELAQEFSSPCSWPSTPPISDNSFRSGTEQEYETDDSSSLSFESLTELTQSFTSRKAPCSSTIHRLRKTMDLPLASLCRLGNLAECEAAVLSIAKVWHESRGITQLIEAKVVDGLMETLCNSEQIDVQKAAVYILTELVLRDDLTRHAILQSDPGLARIRELLNGGLADITVLLYHLRQLLPQMAIADLLPDLVAVTKQSTNTTIRDNLSEMNMQPKAAAILMLEHLFSSSELDKEALNPNALISLDVVPILVESLKARDEKVRLGAVSILLRCARADGPTKGCVSQTVHLTAVLELLHSGDKTLRTKCIALLTELVQSDRRSSTRQLLKLIKNEGRVSSMHALLVHLQMAPLEQRCLTAGLLLQLDLLEEPRKDSIYREEAVEALVIALNSKDRLSVQVEAACTMIATVGRFSLSGKPTLEAWLLKAAKELQDKEQEEDHFPAGEWDKKVARALLGFEQAIILEALAKHLMDKSMLLAKPCITIATWLLWMARQTPDTGIWVQARRTLLPQFLALLESSVHTQQRVLAALALYSFLEDPGSVQELLGFALKICKPLMELKKKTWTAGEILRTFTTSPQISAEVWKHEEINQIDTSSNGEVRAFAYGKGRIYSGHSDGTIKIWSTKRRNLTQLQEVKMHTKCVTSLAILLAKERLYSGSMDKSIRVWAIGSAEIRSVHVIELKESVLGIAVSGPMACIKLQGAGIKVQYGDTATRHINSHKHIQSMAISDDMIYCGCTDNSVQEMNSTGTGMVTIQGGVRTLLGKRPIYALQVSKGQIFAAGAPVDGMAVKVWNQMDKSLVSALSITSEVRSMALNSDFMYFGLSSGVIEVWLRERLVKVGTLPIGSKVNTLVLDGDVLYIGSEDGKIRVWTFVQRKQQKMEHTGEDV